MGLMSEKMLCRKLTMSLLGVLIWMLSIHAGTYASATMIPHSLTDFARTSFFGHNSRLGHNSIPLPQIKLKISDKDLNQSITFASGLIDHMKRLETNLGWSEIHVKKGTPSHGQLIESAPESEALRLGREALIAAKATSHLMNLHCSKYSLSSKQCAKYISSYKLSSTPLGSSCALHTKSCSEDEINSPYRSIDGSCNNIAEGGTGQSFTSYKRLLFPDYLDGIQEPRRSVRRKNRLPSARIISTAVSKNVDNIDSELTLAVMQWSQFVGNDLAHTPTRKMVHSEKSIECCEETGGNLSPRYVHPFCHPISIPMNDAFYSTHNIECMSYVRSVSAVRSDCTFGPLEQMNQASHYLDGSQIYSSVSKKARFLRSLSEGKLIISSKQGRSFLPISSFPLDDCQVTSSGSLCFTSGDSRVNVYPQLTAMHTLWHREHNRIADELANINPSWDDEMLYQETRKIVIAELQHITYNEWLPVVLGKKYAAKINSLNSYSEDVDPSISNSFATAALRFINSLMEGKLRLYKENRLVNSSLNLSEHFNKPMVLGNPGNFDAIVRGLATQLSQKVDATLVQDITSQLFRNGAYGFDILSLDIQRGRDHGIPGYHAFRALCGLPELSSFNSLADVMSEQMIKTLSQVYQHPHDIDLLIGGMCEKPDGDSLLGPTFSCIIGDQMVRTQRGDRYFYKNEDQPAPFSKAQLDAIEDISLARIFCDNSDDIQMMQPLVFKKIKESNNLVSCEGSYIPHLDLQPWKV